MNISRKHATIRYNFASGTFELSVLGKNGISVGSQLLTADSPPHPLASGDLISNGNCSFHFLLPRDPGALMARNGLAPSRDPTAVRPSVHVSAAASAAHFLGGHQAPATQVLLSSTSLYVRLAAAAVVTAGFPLLSKKSSR
jgi:predicted component of type VI protein secretion system